MFLNISYRSIRAVVPCVLVALIALQAPSWADAFTKTQQPNKVNPWGTILPPAEYGPAYEDAVPYLWPPRVIFRSFDDVQRVCSEAGGEPTRGLYYNACISATPKESDTKFCEITARDDFDPIGQQLHDIIQHELAHCKGWPRNHPS